MIEQFDSLAEKFIKKGFWLYFFSFLVSPILYIVKIILSYDLNVEDIGIIYGVMSLMVLLTSFNDIGMTESLNKFVPEYITKKRYDKVKTIVFYAISAQVITGAVIFLAFYFGASFLGKYYFHDIRSTPIIQLFAFFFLGTTFFHVINVFFQAVQNTFLQKLIDFFRIIFILFFVLYIFLNNYGNIYNYSLAWVLGLYFGVIFALFLFYKNYYKIYLKNVKILFSRELFVKIFKYSLLVFLGSQASTILSQIDMQMIIYLLGNKDAGYYTNYLSLISIPFIAIGPIFAFLFPVFSEMIAKNEHNKIKTIKQIFTKNFLSFSIVFSIFFLIFGINIATVLFGDKFLMSGRILQYSIMFLSFNFLLQINFNILAANGKVKERLNIILIAIVFNTILNFILIKAIGVVGAALATGFGWVLIYVLSELKIKEYYSSFEYKYLLKNIIIFSFIGILMYLYIVPSLNNFENRVMEFFLLAGLGIIYFGIYFLVNLGDFKYFLGEIKKTKRKRKISNIEKID